MSLYLYLYTILIPTSLYLYLVRLPISVLLRFLKHTYTYVFICPFLYILFFICAPFYHNLIPCSSVVSFCGRLLSSLCSISTFCFCFHFILYLQPSTLQVPNENQQNKLILTGVVPISFFFFFSFFSFFSSPFLTFDTSHIFFFLGGGRISTIKSIILRFVHNKC